jgi:glycosyltransferase involved in cell wall biosynthesis
MKVAVIGAGSKSGELGGAENFYNGLVSALKELGVDVDFICPISDEADFEKIKETYLTFYDLDLSEYDGVVSTKAPSYLIRHANHVCYLLHTMRVFYDMFDVEFPCPSQELIAQREFIQKLDTAAIAFPRIKKVFVIGNEVKNRLLKYNNIASEILYPGINEDNFKEGSFDYVFLPGRLHRWKRVDLVINSMQYVKSPVRLKIAGTGEDEDTFRRLAKGDRRIEFLGRVSAELLVDLYSNALCVPFVPLQEDYGLVTIESYRSGKPVITCIDSGEPASIVRNGVTGFICNPDPRDIAEKIDLYFQNPQKAREMGEKGKLATLNIRWDAVAGRLFESLKTS